MSLFTSNSKFKKYLSGFVFFILSLVLFDRGLFYLLSALETGFYSKNKFEQRFQNYVKDKNFTTLLLGTSRSYEGIHPCYLEKALGEKVFKETFQGKGPKYNYYFYQLYKKYAGVPRVVIYGVDYFIFNITSDPRWLARFQIMNSREKVGFFSAPLLLLKHKKKIDNFYNNVLIWLKEKNLDAKTESFQDFIDIHDYMGSDMPNSKKNMVTERTLHFRKALYFPYPGIEGEYFMKLLEEWHQEKVKVILVALPDYFGTLKTNFGMRKFIWHMGNLEDKFDNVVFLNYDRLNKFPLKKQDYFLDGGYGQTNSHLSLEGAKEFNALLVKDLEKYIKQPEKK